MTNCTPQHMIFSSLDRKKVEASFTGGDIGSDGGILLLRELDRQLGLTKRVSCSMRDTRHRAYTVHSQHNLIKQRVYALAAGYEDVNDHDRLRQDLCFQTGVGRDAVLASSATLCRFENRATRQDCIAISKALIEHFIARHETPPKELILDVDPTDTTLHGHQENRHYHGYYKSHCYLPLHVFCGDHLLVSLLRPSNIDGSRYAGTLLRLLVKRFREACPDVPILFRGDGAFARPTILHWCENNHVDYIVGMPGNQRLQRLASDVISQAKLEYEAEKKAARLFDEFEYSAKSWRKERRIIVKAEHSARGGNCRFVVTSLSGSPESTYNKAYCPRGNMENGIKQLKLDVYSDRSSCHDFLPNQFRLLLSSLAYVLLTELRLGHCHLTTVAKAYGQTVRLKLIKLGVVVLKNTRRIQFLLPSHHPYQNDFVQAVHSLNSS